MKRSGRLPYMSKKRKEQGPARRACVAAVIERDKVCQWEPLILKNRDRLTTAEEIRLLAIPCWGPPTAHERAHRRNVDYTDPDQCVQMCSGHNTRSEELGEVAYRAGLLVRGNGLPLRYSGE